MATSLQKMLAAKEKAEELAIAKALKIQEKEQAKEAYKELRSIITSFEKTQNAEAKAEAKVVLKEIKATIKATEEELAREKEDYIEESILASGSWAAIYGAIDGTISGFAKATPDILRNISGWIKREGSKHLVLRFNSKISIDLNRLIEKADDIAISVLQWAYRQEYLNETCIYHTDFKFKKGTNNIIFDPNFKELGIYKFSTIISKGIKKNIINDYVNKYLSAPGNNKNYRAKVDILDMAHKNQKFEIEGEEIIKAPQIQEVEIQEVEFIDQNGDFRYRVFIDKIEEVGGIKLTPAEREFLELLGKGLNSRNSNDYGLTNHSYKIRRSSLTRKGILNSYCNITREIQEYQENK